MPFVKLDCAILESSLWPDSPARDIFLTSLLLAVPREFLEPIKQINVRNLDYSGWEAPPGWYGFVPASGPGLIRRAMLTDPIGIEALERLGTADKDSRSEAHEGRRLIRIDGGYLVLNFMDYRDRDYTGAERQKRWRERQSKTRNTVTTSRNTVTSRYETQAEAEAEAYKEREGSARVTPVTELPDAHIPTFDDIKLVASLGNIPDASAKAFFDYHQNQNLWLNKHDRLIDWKSKLRTWAANDQSKASTTSAALPSHVSSGAPITNGAQTIVFSKEFERIIARMQTIKATYGDMQTWAVDDKTEYNRLLARKKELKLILAIVA